MNSVLVRTGAPNRYAPRSTAHGRDAVDDGRRRVVVTGLDAPTIGDLAAASGIGLHELTTRQASLETRSWADPRQRRLPPGQVA